MAEEQTHQTPPGPAIDSSGQAVIDPSRNVLDLVRAETRRQDDLREAENRHVREVLELRAHTRDEEADCQEKIGNLRAEHAQQLRVAEAARIDAIRSVDVEAVQRAAQVQATQANTLATQVATSAETLRTQVADAATAATIALSAALDPIIKDIADLRRAQYEAQGSKTQIVETQARGLSVGTWVGVGVAAFVSLLVLAGLVVSILVASSGP